jgi:hypothetical protein
MSGKRIISSLEQVEMQIDVAKARLLEVKRDREEFQEASDILELPNPICPDLEERIQKNIDMLEKMKRGLLKQMEGK